MINSIKIVPILVGEINEKNESEIISLLLPLFSNEKNFFVVSSDFCHWFFKIISRGSRFNYTDLTSTEIPIYKQIELLDQRAIDYIEKIDLIGFKNYLKASRNTICGRNPIILLLNLLQKDGNYLVKSLQYDQSSKVRDITESSVSYVSAKVFIK